MSLSNPYSDGWKKIDELLKCISVSEYGVWSVNSKDEIFYRNGLNFFLIIKEIVGLKLREDWKIFLLDISDYMELIVKMRFLRKIMDWNREDYYEKIKLFLFIILILNNS